VWSNEWRYSIVDNNMGNSILYYSTYLNVKVGADICNLKVQGFWCLRFPIILAVQTQSVMLLDIANWYHLVIINTMVCSAKSYTLYCTYYSSSYLPVEANKSEYVTTHLTKDNGVKGSFLLLRSSSFHSMHADDIYDPSADYLEMTLAGRKNNECNLRAKLDLLTFHPRPRRDFCHKAGVINLVQW